MIEHDQAGLKRRDWRRIEPAIVEGRVPPHDLEAEAAVLSAIMLAAQDDRFSLADVADILDRNDFYSEAHKWIYHAAVEVDRAGKPVDVVTVGSYLREQVDEESRKTRLAQIGGTGYLTEILDAAPVVWNVRAYAQTVRKLSKLRELILTCQRYAARGYVETNDPDTFISQLEGEIHQLGVARTSDRSIELSPLLHTVYDTMSKSFTDGRPPGIATGIPSYDDLTVGLHRKELTIVAARPGMGKTSLLLAWAVNVAAAEPLLLADDGEPWLAQGAAFFSLEMPREQIATRTIAMESRVSMHRLRTGRIAEDDWGPITQACRFLAALPIEVDDTSALTVDVLRAKVRRVKAKMAKRKARLAVVFLDYLQLMRAGRRHRSRDEEIGEMTHGLLEVAKDEDVAVVAGCQLNRALETRTGPSKRPVMSDLRESGNIEQDAGNVVFIYRPEVYGEKPPEGEEGRTELIIGKQRNGPTGTAVCRYVPTCTRFEPAPWL